MSTSDGKALVARPDVSLKSETPKSSMSQQSLFPWMATGRVDELGGEPAFQGRSRQLELWADMAQRAYAPNTLRAWKNDWHAFLKFTRETQLPSLPSTPETVRKFLLARSESGLAMSTLRRLCSSIARVHRAADLPNPTESEAVRLALRAHARQIGTRQRQARGMVWREIQTYLRQPPTNLRDLRDRALVCVAYDGSLRPDELVNVDLEHVSFEGEGRATLFIPKFKADQEGEGAVAPIVPQSVMCVREFLDQSEIETGPLFRRIIGHDTLGERLTTQSVSDVFQRIGRIIGLPESEWRGLSGHSARVGSTQDLFAANVELPAIMQQGRWKDARMPVRYGERLSVTHGAILRLATRQGRF
jgi:site-specific recombinase XerD